MNRKQSTKKGGTKGKAEGSKGTRRPTWIVRARAIVADVKGYDDETRHAIRNALDENSTDLAELVRRAESGGRILDARGPVIGGDAEAEEFKARAVAYAQKAFDDALAHFEATEGKAIAPFFYTPLEAGPKDVEGYYTDGLFFAGILASKDCPKQFRDLFSAVFADMLGHASDTLRYPFVLPLMYAVVRDICDAQNYCGTAEGLHNALIYAVESFVPEELANAARASLKKE
jgi:hypothetical protein